MEPATSEASNLVRVQLVLKHQKCQHKEVIKRVTKAHEVVEVDGFVFRRKKRAPQDATPGTDQQQQQAAPAPSADTADTAPLPPHSSPSAIKPSLQLTPGANDVAFNPFARSNKLQRDHDMPAAAPAAAILPYSVARTAPAASHRSPAAPQSTAAASVDAAGDMEVDGAAAPEEAAAAEAASAAAAAAEAAEAEAAAAEAAAAVQEPLRFSISGAELTYLVQWLLTTELKKMGTLDPDQLVAAAAGIAQRFGGVLQQHLGAQEQQQEEGQEGAAAGLNPKPGGGLAALPYQIAKLKRALLAKKDKLLQEEAAWQQLQAKYQQLEQALGTTEAAAATAEATATTGVAAGAADGCGEATVAGDGTPSGSVKASQLPAATGAAGADGLDGKPATDPTAGTIAGGAPVLLVAAMPAAAPAAGAAAVACEVAAGVQSQGAAVAAAAEGQGQQGYVADAGAAANAGGAVGLGQPGSAVAARSAALQTWGVQVEALCALVVKMEQLVDKARSASNALQAEYHHDKFKVYPHVNSPAYLIRSIIKPA